MRSIMIISLLMLHDFFNTILAANVTSETSIITNEIWNSWKGGKDNPDIKLNTLQMIKREGYPAESHAVTTKDGYILTLHRIPGGNNSPPVLLQHGLLCTSADWVMLGKGRALAYLLADLGYDVWLGNFRGNTYSKAHISLSPLKSKFWDFSFNEMGIFDLPAMITYITNMTSQPLHTYIGHSMGTTSFFIMASERPEMAQKIQKMIALAPAVFVDHAKSPVKYLVPFRPAFEFIMHFFHNEFLPQSNLLDFLSNNFCDPNLFTEMMCTNVIFIICGFDPQQFDYNLLPVILSHDPAGASTKTLVHFSQVLKSAKFRKYDYGRKQNLAIYNSSQPPYYNLANITVPTAIFYSTGDWLVSVNGAKRLCNSLPNVIDMYEVPLPKFNHVDFTWAKNATELVYERVIKHVEGNNLNNNMKC